MTGLLCIADYYITLYLCASLLLSFGYFITWYVQAVGASLRECAVAAFGDVCAHHANPQVCIA